MLGEVHLVVDVLDRLRALGVQIAVDDFGTGYSSLTFLQRVQVNELKIDRSFVAGMLAFPHDAAIVRATVDLARSFGLLTVAEGVESPAAAHQLEELGVDLGQGYWYARPVPLGDRAVHGRRGPPRLTRPHPDEFTRMPGVRLA